MYSFVPVMDNSDCHFGFYVTLIISLLVMAIALCDDDIDVKVKVCVGLILSAILLFVHSVSYTPDHPLNQQVTGTFVQFQADAFTAHEGKHDVEHHDVYAVYNVAGSLVILKAMTGQTYPPQAILYKN